MNNSPFRSSLPRASATCIVPIVFTKAACRTRENSIMKRETDYILIQRIRECRSASVNILFRGGEPALAGPEFFRYFTEGVKQYITSPVPYGLQSNGTLIDNSYTKFFFRLHHFKFPTSDPCIPLTKTILSFLTSHSSYLIYMYNLSYIRRT